MITLSMFSRENLQKLAEATERILRETGVRVEHEPTLRALRDAGALCDPKTNIVTFPTEVLKALLATLPPFFKVAGRNGHQKLCSFEGEPVLNGIVIDPWILDYPTGAPRRPCLADVIRNTKIQQTLGVDSIYRMIMNVTDVQDGTSQWRGLEAMLLHNDRAHVTAPTTVEELKIILEALQIHNGGHSIADTGLVQVAIPMLSPLTFTNLYGELLTEALAAGCNVQVTVCPMSGSTAPFSNMGSFLLGQAETLAFCAIVQALKPGAPVMSMNSPSAMNMKMGQDLYYTMDKLLWKLASAQLFRYQGLVGGVEMGGTVPAGYGMQSGAESALFMAFAKLSRNPYLSGLGSCYNANGLSAEMIVMQHSFLKAMEFAAPGLSMDDIEESLCSIKENGPSGNFLTDDMTLARLRSGEFFEHPLFDYSCDVQAPAMLQRAREQVLEMERAFVSPVPETVQEELSRYFAKLYRKLR